MIDRLSQQEGVDLTLVNSEPLIVDGFAPLYNRHQQQWRLQKVFIL
jgi:hypothetical protein